MSGLIYTSPCQPGNFSDTSERRAGLLICVGVLMLRCRLWLYIRVWSCNDAKPPTVGFPLCNRSLVLLISRRKLRDPYNLWSHTKLLSPSFFWKKKSAGRARHWLECDIKWTFKKQGMKLWSEPSPWMYGHWRVFVNAVMNLRILQKGEANMLTALRTTTFSRTLLFWGDLVGNFFLFSPKFNWFVYCLTMLYDTGMLFHV